MTPMAGPTPGSGGLRRAEIALRYLLLTGVVVGVGGAGGGPPPRQHRDRPDRVHVRHHPKRRPLGSVTP
jgi:hypothetical protein